MSFENGCGKRNTDRCKMPDWCPLVPMPERKIFNGENAIKSQSLPERVTEAIKEAMAFGWNTCLDAIEGREEDG